MDLSLSPQDLAFVAEAREWLSGNFTAPAPFETLEEEIAWGRRWQAKMAEAGWVGIHWPVEYGGRGASPIQVALFNIEYARSRAPQLVNRVGISHAGPTILAHGTEAQKQRYLPAMLSGEEIWCQLFSEPNAGSDLAAVSTRATSLGADGWILNGQKVWTSYAQYSRWGMCLARSDPEASRHRGLSFYVVDMEAPGVTVRPLKQITGEAEFSEVFFDDVHLGPASVVGSVNDGWRVATTTLSHERGTSFPFKEEIVQERLLAEVAQAMAEDGRCEDPLLSDRLAECFIAIRLLGFHNLRTMTRLDNDQEPGPETSIVKLHWTYLTQTLSELGADLRPDERKWQTQYLWSKAASIAGGTSEIQRNIIGERLLGLPRP